VMLKDNHLAANDGFDAFAAAVRKFRETRPNIQIEIEADTLEQVRAFLEIDGIDVILLDNMKPAEIREAVAAGKNKVKFEASGRKAFAFSPNIKPAAADNAEINGNRVPAKDSGFPFCCDPRSTSKIRRD